MTAPIRRMSPGQYILDGMLEQRRLADRGRYSIVAWRLTTDAAAALADRLAESSPHPPLDIYRILTGGNGCVMGARVQVKQ